jgi:hypothetical protein
MNSTKLSRIFEHAHFMILGLSRFFLPLRLMKSQFNFYSELHFNLNLFMIHKFVEQDIICSIPPMISYPFYTGS